MRKMNLFLIIILLLGIVSIYSKAKDTEFTAKDTLRFKLIPAVKHNIQISAADIDKSIYFIDEIEVNKADYPVQGLSTFLNSDMVLTDVFVNGKVISLREYTKVTADKFEPVIRLQTFNDMKGKCRMYELLYDDVKNLPDTVKIKIKYLINMTDSLSSIKIVDGKITAYGYTFWYPRNLNNNESIKLSVKIPDKVSVILNNTPLPYKLKGYLRTSEVKLTDTMENPLDLSFKKE